MMNLTEDQPACGPSQDRQAAQRDAVEAFGTWLQESLDDVDDVSHQLERVDPFLSSKLDRYFNLAQSVFRVARSQLADPATAEDENLRFLLDELVLEVRDSYLGATAVLARSATGTHQEALLRSA